jgi:pimeloyl-ACP methyl ester carboxylesterase/DNA-binding CsgD family transcriptional regulator
MDSVPVQFVTTSDEYNIAYAVAGQGLPLVRVPSMFSHFSLQWSRGVVDREFSAYSEHFQLVMVDHRGQGSSTRGLPETTSLDDYVRDLELIVDHLELQRFVLLGWSATAKIAVSYALRHPDRVVALLLNQYTDLNRGSRMGMTEMAQSDWRLFLQTAARVGWVWSDPATVVPVLHESTSQDDFLRMVRALIAQPGDEMLRQLRVPTLVMATLEDSRPMGSDADARRIAAMIPDARLVLFDDLYGGFKPDESGSRQAISVVQRFLHERCGISEASVLAGSGLTKTTSTDAETPEVEITPKALSARQVEVLRLVAEGRTTREISERLFLSERTVERHIADVYNKIGARNRSEATAYALRHFL